MTGASPDQGSASARPALLVSVHDVSPLTLGACREAVALAEAAGVPREALTLLVIPRHEDRAPLDEDEATRDWLQDLARDGATLVLHGFTHRMEGRALGPSGLVWAHGFARGQGELFRASELETARRLSEAAALLQRAGLEQALRGFVPPAWLLSDAALEVVRRAGFEFYEVLGGIVHGSRTVARRVIGLGSLNAVEATVTSAVAALQAGRTAVDTRLAMHPQDLERSSSRRALERTLRRLLEAHTPLAYARFLGLED